MSHKGDARRIKRLELPEVLEGDDMSQFIRAKRLARVWDCDVKTIKRLVAKGDLPGYMRGPTLVIRRTDAEIYIEKRRVEPTPKRVPPKRVEPKAPAEQGHAAGAA
jgi:hypothetical protein